MEEIHQPDGNIAIGMLPENVALTVAVEAANQFDAPAGPVDGPSRPLSPRNSVQSMLRHPAHLKAARKNATTVMDRIKEIFK
jgi:hypothetical protein